MKNLRKRSTLFHSLFNYSSWNEVHCEVRHGSVLSFSSDCTIARTKIYSNLSSCHPQSFLQRNGNLDLYSFFLIESTLSTSVRNEFQSSFYKARDSKITVLLKWSIFKNNKVPILQLLCWQEIYFWLLRKYRIPLQIWVHVQVFVDHSGRFRVPYFCAVCCKEN